jgi:hypothetical protein
VTLDPQSPHPGQKAGQRAAGYWLTTTGPQAIGAASMKLLRFASRLTTMRQAMLGVEVHGLIAVALDALPELSPVSKCGPKTF